MDVNERMDAAAGPGSEQHSVETVHTCLQLPPSYFLFSLPLRPPSAVSHQADKAQRALGVR